MDIASILQAPTKEELLRNNEATELGKDDF